MACDVCTMCTPLLCRIAGRKKMTQPESGARVRSLSVQTLRGSRYSHGTPVCRQHDVASPASYLKIFRHPAHPKLTLTTTSLAVQAVPGTRIVVYRPTDEVTRIAIASS